MRRTRLGFTLVELLVVIAIIGILVAMLLPAISAAREAGRRADCMNRLRQLSVAVLNHEQAQRKFPGYGSVQAIDSSGRHRGTGWLFPLLPYFESKEVFDRFGRRGPMSTRGQMPFVQLPGTTCPSDFIAEQRLALGWYTATDYVANVGQWDAVATESTPSDWRANGLFVDRFPFSYSGVRVRIEAVTASYVSGADGLSKTFMLSENVDAGFWPDDFEASIGFGWEATMVEGQPRPATILGINEQIGQHWLSQFASGGAAGGGSSGSSFDAGLGVENAFLPNGHFPVNPSGGDTGPIEGGTNPNRPNSPRPIYPHGRPSSFHPGGVVVTYADGHVQFLRDDIPYLVYCALMTPNGGRSLAPGTSTAVPQVYRSAASQGAEAE